VRQLLLEKVALIQEQDHISPRKPLEVADLIKKSKRFVHAVDVFIFVEQLVVPAEENKRHKRDTREIQERERERERERDRQRERERDPG